MYKHKVYRHENIDLSPKNSKGPLRKIFGCLSQSVTSDLSTGANSLKEPADHSPYQTIDDFGLNF